jgi:hypothetical protein
MVTPIQSVGWNLERLAVGCLYLLTNKATLEFPTTSRAHPSFEVVVNRTPGTMFRSGDWVYFPFSVETGVWHQAVVPVLENKDVQVYVTDNPSLRVFPNLILITIEQVEDLISKIEAYLRESFVSAGYLPAGFSQEAVQEAGAPEGPAVDADDGGEPIVYPETVDPDLYHPDGTPKLSYRVVDQ